MLLNLLLHVEGRAEVENSHDKNHQQRQGDGEFQQLRARGVAEQALSTDEIAASALALVFSRGLNVGLELNKLPVQ